MQHIYKVQMGNKTAMITPEEIKAARIAAGLTQEQAAAVVGFTRNGWQKAEYGEKKMRPAIFELFKLKTEKKAVTAFTADNALTATTAETAKKI